MNAPTNKIKLEGKEVGDQCPCCGIGKLYPSASRKLLEFKGNAPIEVTRHEKEVLRCNACGGELMSAKRIDKWTDSARSSVVLQKVKGVPFYRLSKLQSLYNIPIAPSTLWMQCLNLWERSGIHIYKQLLREAANSKIFYLDDTKARILEVISANKGLPESQRRACNTTVVRTNTETKDSIILYITDKKYCGENFGPVLESRGAINDNHYVKLVVDASSRNNPMVNEELRKKVIMANCMAHARDKFVKLLDYHPCECKYFLDEIAQIYKREDECRNYCPRKKLRYRKQHSSIHIKNIYSKIEELFNQKLVEPNSGLGKAMKYWINHRKGLTAFLRIKGIEIDNNGSERSLKEMILQRKNSLFFKTRNSALVLSGLSSIVYSCEANGINAFMYLNWIQANERQVEKDPGCYTPWKYMKYLNDTELIAA